MCGFCAAVEVADPCATKGMGSIQAELAPSDPGTIGFSIPDDTSSTEIITIGGTRDETLEFIGDQDWFRLDLNAGDAIQIDLFGLDHDSGNGLGELLDPYVRIRDASGNFLAENDDIVLGVQRDSRLVFQTSETASYFIEVDSYLSDFTGDYRLQVASLSSSDTIPDDTTTIEAVTVGSIRNGTLDFTGDSDWYRIDLTAGDAVEIELRGNNHDNTNGLGALSDPFLVVRDASGNALVSDNNSGTGTNANVVFQALTTGTYFIDAGSNLDSLAGDYQLEVAETAPPPPASPVDAMQTSFTLNTNDPVLVYFAEAGDTYNYDGDTYVATGVNAYEQAQLFSVFEGVEEFVDIDFQITTNRNAADLEWATDTLPSTDGGTLLGFFFFPSSNGNGGFGILNNNSSSFPSWKSNPGGTLDTGGFMYGVAVHELGHGLGLAHSHDGGGGSDVMQGVSSSSSRGSFGLNSAPFTAMSYNEGWADNPAGLANSVASTGHGATFGALDIAALQNMYSANTTHAGGNDVYDLIDTDTTGSGAGYYATWDTGGTDEFRYTGTRDATIDLRDATLLYENGGGGFMSHVSGVIAGRTIANGVVIENATGSAGDDTLTGNEADNLLTGNGGNDSLFGGAGNDTLDAGAGDDTISGDEGEDLIIGGTGDDTLSGGADADTFEFNFGDGFDTIVDFEIGTDLIDLLGLGIAFTDLLITDVSGDAQVKYDFTTTGQITLTGVDVTDLTANSFIADVAAPPPQPLPTISGDAGNNELAGSAADEELLGLGGNDGLNGRGGADVMRGGTGNDRYYLDNAGDTVIEEVGEGYDRVYSSVSFALTDNVEAGATLGAGDIDITGNDLVNWITGNAGSNELRGGGGNDRLISYGGSDTLNGDAGNDVLEGGADADVFAFDAGAGTDVITDFEIGVDLIDVTSLGIAYADMIIVDSGANAVVIWDDPGAIGTRGIVVINNVLASDLLLSSFVTSFGSSQPVISGTAGNDVMIGSQIGDEILGLGGNDLLNGAGGDDTMIGGTGNDSYYVDDAGDLAVELAGEGHDRVYASIDHTLAEHIEDISASGSGVVALTGNAGANWLTGNAAANGLSGAGGNDRLIGRAGEDTLEGGTGNDLLEGGLDADTFVFNAGDGTDSILDYEDGVDLIDVSSLGITFGDLRIVDSGSNAIIFYDETDPADRGLVVVSGHSASDFAADDFVFV